MAEKVATLPMSEKYSLELIDYAHEVKAQKLETEGALLKELEEEFKAMCAEKGVDEARAEEFFAAFSAELLKRPHLAKFTKDAKGCSSMFFPKWVMDIIGKLMSRTMFPAYFKGYTIENKLEEIPETDPFYIWSKEDPVFRYVRERDELANEVMQEPGVERILNPGAGNCPEIFELDYDPELLKRQEIRCCDIADTGMKEKISDLPKFSYDYMDMTEFIQKEATFGPNLIVMKGTLSYQMDALPKVLTIASQLLAPGGKLFFDLQLVHWAFLRNLETFTWGEGTFGLLDSPEAATGLVKKVISKQQLPFEVSGAEDTWSRSFFDEHGDAVGTAFILEKAK